VFILESHTAAMVVGRAQHASRELDVTALRDAQDAFDRAWPADATLERFLTGFHAAAAAMALDGERAGVTMLHRARLLAPYPGWEAYVECIESRVYFDRGEMLAAQIHVEAAAQAIARAKSERVCAGTWFALAECAIPFDRELAQRALAIGAQRVTDDEEVWIHVYTAGRVAEALGDRDGAARSYRHAFDLMRAGGDVRSAIIAATRLGSLMQDAAAWRYVREYVGRCHPTWWPMQALSTLASRARIPKLSAMQQKVLTGICAGETNRAIAQRVQRSVHRVGHIVSRLFKMYGVENRSELARAASVLPGTQLDEKRQTFA
jgi:DNA-binding CsgD family transcriptional regulator